MKTLFRSMLGLVVLLIALGVGFVAAVGVILASNAVLPPFRREDDDTLREFIPVALAYATMAGTTALVFVMTWRRLRSGRGAASRDIAER